MTTPRDPDRLIHAFLLEGAEQLQDQVYDVVRAEIDQKRQRVVIGPWRVPTVSKLVPIGLGAAAVIAVLFLGSQFIGSPTSNLGGPTTQPPASAAPSDVPTSAAPPLTQTFTSTQHGFSVSYPEGWTAQAATEPWTGRDGFGLVPMDPFADVLTDPLTNNLFLLIASQPIGSSTPDEWVAETMGTELCSTTEPIAVDSATGRIGTGAANACAAAVAVTIAGRGYWIRLFTPNTLEGVPYPPFDRAWFEEVLATVQLQPKDAVDAAPSPAPRSQPPLTQSFTSPLHGISLSYPEGWNAQVATEPWTDGTHQPNFTDPFADDLMDAALEDHLFLSLASQPLGDSTPDEWVAEQMANNDCSATEPIAVDGATGLIGTNEANGCDGMVAVSTADRGYWIILRTSDDDPSAVASYDRAWFEEVLSTVQLHPEDAVD